MCVLCPCCQRRLCVCVCVCTSEQYANRFYYTFGQCAVKVSTATPMYYYFFPILLRIINTSILLYQCIDISFSVVPLSLFPHSSSHLAFYSEALNQLSLSLSLFSSFPTFSLSLSLVFSFSAFSLPEVFPISPCTPPGVYCSRISWQMRNVNNISWNYYCCQLTQWQIAQPTLWKLVC